LCLVAAQAHHFLFLCTSLIQAGGAIYADESVLRINDSKLVGNEATLVSGSGGAIFSFNSKIDLGSTVFLNNKAGETGTAVRSTKH